MRIAKYMARCGVASRRAGELLIASGAVTVDGVVVTNPACDVDGSRTVAVDGRPVKPEKPVVYAVNKPEGVISTAADTHGRPVVTDLVTGERRLYPVGRLDAGSTGLILLTNDGELANRLTHPRYEVPKTYRVRVGGPKMTARELAALARGVELDDGVTARATVTRRGPNEFEIVIREGRNRQIRRMCESIGRRVLGLERVGFGPLVLGDLKSGKVRRLKPREIELLRGSSTGTPGGASRAALREKDQ